MAAMQHKALRFAKTGDIKSVLTVASVPIPRRSPSQSLIRVHASAINPSDVSNVEGKFKQTTLPRTPGRDYAGVVVDGPADKIGMKVWGTGGVNGFQEDGSHATYMLVASDALDELPASLSFAQGAACGVAYLTSGLMARRAAVQKGDFVLVLGSTGSVGSAAVGLVRLAGAVPLETSRKTREGAVDISAELGPQIEKLTGGKGLSVVIDTVGEAGLFKKAMAALGPYGRYVFISVKLTPDAQYTLDGFGFYRDNKTLIGVNTLTASSQEAASLLKTVAKGFEDGKLTPPANLEEVDLNDEQAVVAAYEKVKAGSKTKQILIVKDSD